MSTSDSNINNDKLTVRDALSDFPDDDNHEEVSPAQTDTITLYEGVDRTALSFSDLIHAPTLLDAVSKLGFQTPTPVQQTAIPYAQQGRDLIIQAQTGSGKTLAFLLPLLHLLKEADASKGTHETFALLLTPTRELALQIQEVFQSIEGTIKPVCLIGGSDLNTQREALTRDRRVVVGTPGRVLDCMRQRLLKLHTCRYFVLDEADEMLSIGFLEDVRAILSRLPDRRQGLFVSATLTPRVDMLANSFLVKPLSIITPASSANLPPITHYYCEVGSDIMAKPTALCDLIETRRPNSAIIFCNTKSDTHLVEVLLRRRGFDARRINSELSQRQRTAVMNKLRAKDLRFLVATDIAARGIDISQIDLVINYSIHDQPEIYVHRTGRTGRAGRAGIAISLVGPRDFGAFHFLGKVSSIEFQKLQLPTEEDVADARLAHLYEIVREANLEIKRGDLLTARKLLNEMGGIAEPNDDLELLIAKLCRFTFEHYIAQEAASLDEEKELERESARDAKKGERADDKQEHQRPPRRRDDRQDRDKDRDRNKRSQHDDPRRREDQVRSDKAEEPQEVRLYIGQGLTHGMTVDEFKNLALELAELSAGDLRHLVIREHYGFVDLVEDKAKTLLSNLGGILYNGAPLPIEVATVITSPAPGHRNRRSNPRQGDGHHRGRDSHRERRDGGSRRRRDR